MHAKSRSQYPQPHKDTLPPALRPLRNIHFHSTTPSSIPPSFALIFTLSPDPSFCCTTFSTGLRIDTKGYRSHASDLKLCSKLRQSLRQIHNTPSIVQQLQGFKDYYARPSNGDFSHLPPPPRAKLLISPVVCCNQQALRLPIADLWLHLKLRPLNINSFSDFCPR